MRLVRLRPSLMLANCELAACGREILSETDRRWAERVRPAFPESTRHGHACDLNERQLSGTRQGLLIDWNEGAKPPFIDRTFYVCNGAESRL